MVARQRTSQAKAKAKAKARPRAGAIAKRVTNMRKAKLPVLHFIPVDVRDLFFKTSEDKKTKELRMLLEGYISANDALVEVSVPGDLCPTRKHKKTADHVRNVISALLDWFDRLNDLEFSLDGKFELSDWGITHSGFLKGRDYLMKRLLPFTESRTKNDMSMLGTAIENIFNLEPPPADADLIGVLKGFKPTLKPLLQIHVARENGMKKGIIFTKMYGRLLAVQDDGTNRYTNVLSQIPLGNWIHKAMSNVHLHYLLRFKFGVELTSLDDKILAFLNNSVGYRLTKEEHLKFRRNGEAHLIQDYSLGTPEGLEEALRAAAAAGAVVMPSLAAIFSHPELIPGTLPHANNPEFKNLLTAAEANAVAVSIAYELKQFKKSRAAARAAAETSARERVKDRTKLLERSTLLNARFKGNHEGLVVLSAEAAQGTLVEPLAVRRMFDEEDVSDMMELVDSDLLYRFQRAMFDEGLLDDWKLHEKSAAVRLL